tara:strand:- start:59013 stop:59165 length:153 start_codon:yes stop_codon:yes gene_type:complete
MHFDTVSSGHGIMRENPLENTQNPLQCSATSLRMPRLWPDRTKRLQTRVI